MKLKREEDFWQQVGLPRDMLVKIAAQLDDNTLFSFAMAHPVLREIQEEVKPKDPQQDKKIIQLRKLGYLGHRARFKVSAEWIRWAFKEMGQESYLRIDAQEDPRDCPHHSESPEGTGGESTHDLLPGLGRVLLQAQRLGLLGPKNEKPQTGDDHRQYLIFLASQNGHKEEVKWLHEEGCSLTEKDTEFPSRNAFEYAALGGHLKVLQWARAQGCPWDRMTCDSAAEGGHLKVLQWARAQGCPWDWTTCYKAAREGHLEVLQWAREQGCPWEEEDICSCAAQGGHLKVLQWAREQGCPWDQETCSVAAGGGHLKVLQWARARGCPWYKDTCARAAHGGHLKVLQWARAQQCPWDDMTCTYAAQRGHLKVLQWAVEQGCPWDKRTICTHAADGGDLKVLQWARAQGCPWGEYTCYGPAIAGHLKVLQWLREQGCPWDKERCLAFARGRGREEVVAWIEQQ